MSKKWLQHDSIFWIGSNLSIKVPSPGGFQHRVGGSLVGRAGRSLEDLGICVGRNFGNHTQKYRNGSGWWLYDLDDFRILWSMMYDWFGDFWFSDFMMIQWLYDFMTLWRMIFVFLYYLVLLNLLTLVLRNRTNGEQVGNWKIAVSHLSQALHAVCLNKESAYRFDTI